MPSESLVQLGDDLRLPSGEIAREDVLACLPREFEVKGQIVHAANVQGKVFIGLQQMPYVRPGIKLIYR